MTNPYAILGLTPDATDEQVKAAYLRLVRQYSDSEYTADPLDTADARMDTLNAAYDQIMAERRTGGQTGSAADSAQTWQDASGGYDERAAQNYTEIRRMIRANDILTAEQRLMAIDPPLRGAEWNFLMGCVCQSKGWLDEAYRYFSSASSIDPRNAEYAAAYNRMTRERATGGSAYNPYAGQRRGGCLDDDVCSNAMQCMCLYSLCSSCCCGRS